MRELFFIISMISFVLGSSHDASASLSIALSALPTSSSPYHVAP